MASTWHHMPRAEWDRLPFGTLPGETCDKCSAPITHYDAEGQWCGAHATQWSAEEAAAGHGYQGPGYCAHCGVREDLHAR